MSEREKYRTRGVVLLGLRETEKGLEELYQARQLYPADESRALDLALAYFIGATCPGAGGSISSNGDLP